ncbi:MAG: CHC2 zinc finger domain-containing protein [Macellibacteroides fermentans]|uniref:CHC2 zinc finger domain-containing protein n=1 Tax=Macellibacteroides fermentans TaxID=879969 RepID=UPI003ACFBA37
MGCFDDRAKVVKERVDIRSVVGEWVALSSERAGKSMGLCPFHADHHPSLVVNSNKGSFVCYACGEKGDVLAFVMRKEGCSFYEALLRLEARVGILPPASGGAAAPTFRGKEAAAPTSRQDKAAAPTLGGTASRAAAPAPSPSLFDSEGDSLPFDSSDEDLVQIRKREEEVLIREELLRMNGVFLKGLERYDPGCEGLGMGYLNFEVGFAPKPAVYRGEGIFRPMLDRVIFPLRDGDGLLVGFSARHRTLLAPGEKWGKDSPKYINSAASVLFRKGEVLYGLYRAKKAIRRAGYAILVEGYKDVIAMHVAGFEQTVGLGGVELTQGHIGLLEDLCTRVVVLTDGDEPGRRAVSKIVTALQAVGFGTLVLSLPEGEDPDSLFRSLAAEGLAVFIQSLLVPPELLAPLPAQLSQQMPSEGEVVVDIDRLVAALPFVTRANEKAAIYKRIALLKAKLEAASALLNRPPSVL